MNSVELRASEVGDRDWSICRLCLVSDATRPHEDFVYIHRYSGFLLDLFGSEVYSIGIGGSARLVG